jgi:polyvinyl alcohol dehydrogenase (cytochrome)
MSPARILRTLDFGLMMSVAYPLRRDEREAVAAFLGKGPDDTAPPAQAMCKTGRPLSAAGARGAWTGWSPSAANTRFQTAEQAGLTAAAVPRLELKWAFGFPGDVTAFAAPTVLDGTLFVGSAAGTVQAIDAQRGCIHWIYKAGGPVRSGDDDRSRGAAAHAAVQRSERQRVRGGRAQRRRAVEDARRSARGDAVDRRVRASRGHRVRPRRVVGRDALDRSGYKCCTFRGSITAVRVRDGSVVWKTYLVDPPVKTGTTAAGTDTFGPSGAGVWSAPTVDAGARRALRHHRRQLLVSGHGDERRGHGARSEDRAHRVVAADHAERRLQLRLRRRGANCPPNNGPDFDFGSSALLVKTAGAVMCWWLGRSPVSSTGSTPPTAAASCGRRGWAPAAPMAACSGAWPATASASTRRCRTLAGRRQHRRRGGLGQCALSPTQGGGLTALDVLDGAKVWVAPGTPCAPPRAGCSPAQPAAVTAIPGVVFSGAMDGHLRAFSTADGKLLWDVDTAKTYITVNGVPGTGGSLDGVVLSLRTECCS